MHANKYLVVFRRILKMLSKAPFLTRTQIVSVDLCSKDCHRPLKLFVYRSRKSNTGIIDYNLYLSLKNKCIVEENCRILADHMV